MDMLPSQRIRHVMRKFTCTQGRQQDAVSAGKVRVQVPGGVSSASDSGDLLHATAAQLMQHEPSVPLRWHLLLVWLDATNEMELRPAHAQHFAFHFFFHRRHLAISLRVPRHPCKGETKPA